MICCLIYLLFLIAFVVCGLYGFSQGEPELLTYPYDSSGNQCGKDLDAAEDYPYIYWPYPIPGYFDWTVCVKDCPDDYDDTVECKTNEKFENCNFRWEETVGYPHEEYGYIKGIYPSTGYLERICLPDSDSVGWLNDALNDINDEIDVDTMRKWIGDVFTVWFVAIIVAGICLVIAFFYMVFLRYCVGVLVWLSIILTLAVLLLIGGFAHWSSDN